MSLVRTSGRSWKEPGEIIVETPFWRCSDGKRKEIGKDGHDEHVAQHRCPGNHVNMAPAVLEPELSAEIDKIPVFLVEGKLLDTGKIIVAFLSLLQESLDGRDLVAVGIGTLDNIKLPPCRVKVSGVKNPFIDRIVVCREIMLKSFR